MKSNYFPKQDLVRRAVLVYFFANLFSVWSNRTSLSLVSASAFSLSCCVVVAEV